MNVLGKGTYVAGARKGNDDHYIEQHERAIDATGNFRKRVTTFRDDNNE